jgi:hypothetical protein
MYFRLFLKLIFVVALVIIQISFISGLPLGLRELNLIIIYLVFFLEWNQAGKMIWWFLLIGFIFDIYLSVFFGFFMILWPLCFLFAGFLFNNFFTNRSLYSFLGLTFFTTIFYYLFFNLFFYFGAIFSPSKPVFFLLAKNFWLSLGNGLLVNLIAVFILFNLVNILSDRLKPVFIIKNKI